MGPAVTQLPSPCYPVKYITSISIVELITDYKFTQKCNALKPATQDNDTRPPKTVIQMGTITTNVVLTSIVSVVPNPNTFTHCIWDFRFSLRCEIGKAIQNINLYCTGIGDLNPCIMGLLTRFNFRANGLAVCHCNTQTAGLSLSCNTQTIKVNHRFQVLLITA